MVQECDLRKAPTCWGNTTAYDGINLIYAAGDNHNVLRCSQQQHDVDDCQVTAMLQAASQWNCTMQTQECCSVDMTLYMERPIR